jgi:hypothetical protein
MSKELTKRQRYWLEHIQEAERRGQTLKAYAKKRQLSLGAMYRAKSSLMKSGALPRGGHEQVVAEFVPVRIEPLAATPSCRLRHPSGWELECEGWPDPQWLRAVMGGGFEDAST